MRSSIKLSSIPLALLLAATVSAQTSGTPNSCSAGQIRSHAKAKVADAIANANLKLAKEALELSEEHQTRLDASFQGVKADLMGSFGMDNSSVRELLTSTAEKWSEKALKARNRAKEKALKAAQKALASAQAKKSKTEAKLSAVTPKDCSLN